MSQKRIFGFLWPDTPSGPVDDQARQTRFVRVTPRGPLRILVLIILTLTSFSVAFLGSLVAGTARTPLALLAVVLAVLPLVAVTARGWQVGTFVNDGGVRIIRMFTTISIPWSAVLALDEDSRAVRIVTTERLYPTHIRRDGCDHITSTESYDMARDRLTNWWQQR